MKYESKWIVFKSDATESSLLWLMMVFIKKCIAIVCIVFVQTFAIDQWIDSIFNLCIFRYQGHHHIYINIQMIWYCRISLFLLCWLAGFNCWLPNFQSIAIVRNFVMFFDQVSTLMNFDIVYHHRQKTQQ